MRYREIEFKVRRLGSREESRSRAGSRSRADR
jgi:hypothetical protein